MTVDKPQSYIFQKKINDVGLLCVGATKDGFSIILEDSATKERKTVFDGISGAAVSSLPHCDPEIAEAMGKFAKESVYTFGAYFANHAAEDLGKFMCDNSKGAFASALWTASGSESNENAMKIMRQYFLEKGESKRYKFISRTQSYHGFTIGSLSIGDGSRKPPFKPILLSDDQTPKVSNVYSYRNQKGSEEDYTKTLLAELEQCFVDNDPETVCGVIFETVGGSTIGTPTPPKGYLDGARAICHKYGALFMLDEVMCGLGRCGYPYTFMHPDFGLSTGGPDLLTVGKTIGSGFVTLAGILISPQVKKVFDEGSGYIMGGQTYHSHDFNCRVGLAVQQKIYRDNLIENCRVNGQYLKDQLKESLKDCKILGDVRGAGDFISLEAVKDKATKEPFDPSIKLGPTISSRCLEKGLYVMGAQGCIKSTIDDNGNVTSYGDHITLAPAFGFTKEHADFITKIVSEVFLELEKELL